MQQITVMIRFILSPVFFLCFWSACGTCSEETAPARTVAAISADAGQDAPMLAQAWESLLGNNLQAALPLFENCANREAPTLAALEGLYQCQRALGLDNALWKTITRQAQHSLRTPMGDFFFSRVDDEAEWTGRISSFRTLCVDLAARKPCPAVSCTLSIARYNDGLKLLDAPLMKQMLQQTGDIPLYARLIGPFVLPQHMPERALPVLPPQLHPEEETFADYNGHPVKIRTNYRLENICTTDFGDLVGYWPGAAVYFAQVAVRSDRQQTVSLHISGYDYAWLNSQPVYTPDLFANHPNWGRNVNVVLNAGVNTLMFLLHGGNSAQLMILGEDGGKPAGLEYLPFRRDDWIDVSCKDAGGWCFSQIREPLYLAEIRKTHEQNNQDNASMLWYAEALEKSGRWEEAETLWESILQTRPDSVVVLDSFGHFLRRAADRHLFSRARLQKQAGEYFCKALTLNPGDLNASLGLALMNTVDTDDRQSEVSAARPALAARRSTGESPFFTKPYTHTGMSETMDQGTIFTRARSNPAPRIASANSDALFRINAGYYRCKGNIPQEKYLNALTSLKDKYPASMALIKLLLPVYQSKSWGLPAQELLTRYRELNPEDHQALVAYLSKTGEDQARDQEKDLQLTGHQLSPWSRIEMLTDAQKFVEAREELRKAQVAFPEDRHFYYWNLYKICTKEGKAEEGRKALEELEKAYPADPGYPRQIGKDLLRTGDTKTALAYFEKAAQLLADCRESDQSVLNQISQLRGGPSTEDDHDRTVDIVTLKDIKKDDHPRASHATVLRLRTVRLSPGYYAESYEHHAVKLLDKSGIEDLSELPLPSQGRVLACRTLQEDGSVFIPDSAENIAFGKAMSMYNVRIGSTLDYSFREKTRQQDSFKDSFTFEDFDTPVLFARYTLILPKTMFARADITTVPEDFAPAITEENGLVTLVWEARDQAGVEQEDNLPPDDPVLRSVEIQLHDELPPVYETAYRLSLEDTLVIPPALRTFTENLLHGTGSDAEKVTRIFNWIAAEIHDQSVRDYSSSPQPYDTFLSRTGNSEEKGALCQAMLTVAGLNSYFVDPNASITAAGFLFGNGNPFDSFSSREYLKILLPAEAEDRWLCFRNDQSFFRPGDLGRNVPGQISLERSPWGRLLACILPASMELRIRRTPDRIELHPDGSAQIHSATTYYGVSGAGIRDSLDNPHSADEFLNNFATGRYPRIADLEFQKPSASELKTMQQRLQPVVIGFRGTIKDFCSVSGNRLSFPAFTGETNYVPATPLPRKYPLSISGDTMFADVRIYHAPVGWTFRNLPRDEYISSDFGTAMLDCNVTGNTLTITRNVLIPQQQLDPEECEAYNNFAGRIQKFDETTITLEPVAKNLSLRTAVSNPGYILAEDPAQFSTFSLPDSVSAFLDDNKEDTPQRQPKRKKSGKTTGSSSRLSSDASDE